MSNTILVHKKYCPFRWIGDTLQAFVKGAWVNVTKTTKKNQYGDYIFEVIKGVNHVEN